jgi:hypothetical protein
MLRLLYLLYLPDVLGSSEGLALVDDHQRPKVRRDAELLADRPDEAIQAHIHHLPEVLSIERDLFSIGVPSNGGFLLSTQHGVVPYRELERLYGAGVDRSRTEHLHLGNPAP